jgi:sterol carrier protein 2
MVYEPITKLQCCPTSDGGAAAVVVSQAFLDARPHLKSQAVLIAGQCLASDSPSLYDKSAIGLVGAEMTSYAAEVAMKEAQVTTEDIKVSAVIPMHTYQAETIV